MEQFRHWLRLVSQDRYRYWRFGGFLFAVQFICFPTVFLGADTFIYRDFGFFGYPLAHYHREAFWDGRIPLWNPLSNMGIPFLAQWNSLTLYPGTIIYMLLPLGWGVSMFCILHQWFGGMGMFTLVERWTGNRTAASIAGVIYSLNGLFLNSLAWPNNAAALGWFPWMLLALIYAVSRGGRFIPLAAVCGGLQMLTGGPEIIFFSWIFCGAVAMASVPWQWKKLLAAAGRLSLVSIWVAGLAAAQLLPFLNLLRHSHRNSSFSTDGWSMPITGWGNFIVPKFQTYFSQAGVHFQPDQVWTTSYYVGIFTLILMGVWLVSRPGFREWVIFLMVLAAANLALGPYNPFYGLLKGLFPGIGFMRYPVKFVIVMVMGMPILAGLAWSRWVAADSSRRVERRWGLVFLGLVSVLAVFLVSYTHLWPLQRESVSRVLENGLSRMVYLWLLAGLAFLAVRDWRGSRRWAPVAIPVILAMELVTHTAPQNPTVNNHVYEPNLVTLQDLEPVPVHGRSRAMLSPTADYQLRFTSTPDPLSDYLIYRSGLFSNCNLLEGLSKINGFYSLYIGSSMDILRIFYGVKPVPATPLKNFLGISHYTSRDAVFEWSPREDFMPMVTSGQKPVFGSAGDILKVISSEDFRPAEHVFLNEEDESLLKSGSAEWGTAAISNLSVEPEHIVLDTQSAQPSMLVIAQNHYPSWKAFIDGSEVPLLRANHSFQALELPPGSHHVEVRYRDEPFMAGLKVSSISLLAAAVTGFRRRKTRPGSGAQSDPPGR